MSWNYRVIRNVLEFNGQKIVEYDIREVYYDKRGKPTFVSSNPNPIAGDDSASLKWTLSKMKAALKKPVLDMSRFEPSKTS